MTETTPEPETTPEESPLQFTFTPVKVKPTRAYKKGSKYDPVLNAFLASGETLSSLAIEGRTANYLRTQLDKRINSVPDKYRTISVKVVNNVCYLEIVTPEKKKKK
jgi:hypothetical protein